MLRKPILLIVLIGVTTAGHGQDRRKVNAPFGGKADPFLEVLGLGSYHISVHRDSTRISFRDQSGSVDLLMRNKRLWRCMQFNRAGKRMEDGDLSNGDGRVLLEMGRHRYEATFSKGILDGPFTRYDRIGKAWIPMLVGSFSAGLLQGELRYRSIMVPSHIAVVEQYDNGLIWKRETYGRRNWMRGFLLFLVSPLKDEDQVCSRTLYDAGVVRAHECLLGRKCRWCGT